MSSCVLQVYLADYGLSYRYCPDGVHKEFKENPKKGHNGTIEYTSLDAHRGAGKPLSPDDARFTQSNFIPDFPLNTNYESTAV